MAVEKRYIYRVYNTAGTFVGLWNDVISEFNITESINSAGSDLVVVLARPADNFNEGVDIDFNFRVKVSCVDVDNVNGVQVFDGRIRNYMPVFGQDERIEVTLLGGGADLNDYMIDYGDSIIQESEDADIIFAAKNLGYYVIAQTFTLTEKTRIRSVDLFLYSTDNSTVRVSICSGTPVNYLTSTGLIQGSCEKLITNIDAFDIVTFTFPGFGFASPIELSAGTYHLLVEVVGHGTGTGNHIKVANGINPYSGGALYSTSDNVTDATQTFSTGSGGNINGAYDLWFRINAGTIQPYGGAGTSYDPSDVLKSILDYYALNGGTISYSVATIDTCGTIIKPYTFNTNTTLEGIQKVLELAPVEWYWYIDQSTNLLHFHKKSGSIQHTFLFGKDIINLQPEKRTEDIINQIYFTGGGTPALFKKYEDTTSIALYGVHLLKYVDQRVTDEKTAQKLATRILQQRNAPEIRLSFEVIDNNVDSTWGSDIDGLKIGDTVGIRNIGGGASSLWDVAYWDQDYWDFKVSDLSTLNLQITRIERSPSSAKVFCSTVPPDVNKKVEDINRSLQATQTANNPQLTS